MTVVAQFWTLVAIATLAGAIFMACRTMVFVWRSVITTGTIKDFETTSLIVSDGSDAHGHAQLEHTQYARFEFRTDDGARVEVLSRVGEWPTRLSAGDRVRVRYARHDPKLAEIDSWWRLWGPALALALIGFGAAGAAYLIRGVAVGSIR